MQNDFKEEASTPTELEQQEIIKSSLAPKQKGGLMTRGLNLLAQMGLGEALLRGSTNLFSVLAIVMVLWLAQRYFQQAPNRLTGNSAQAPDPAATAVIDLNTIPAYGITSCDAPNAFMCACRILSLCVESTTRCVTSCP